MSSPHTYTYSIDSTANLAIADINATQLLVTKSKPGGENVSITSNNSGSGGYASVYVSTTNQTINETGQIFVGAQGGMTMMTRTNHPIVFKTYSDQANFSVPNSMQILSNSTRDVQILSPLRCLGAISTFDYAMNVGSGLNVDSNCLNVNASALFSGNLTTASTSILRINKIRVNGNTSNDSVIISNIDGTTIASFSNTTAMILNGPTNILGETCCSHKIDCYRFTATEILSRDTTNALSFGTSTGAACISITPDADVEILAPLKIKSSSTTQINNGISVGILQPTASVGINCYSSATIGGNLTVTGFISAKPYVSLNVVTSGGTPSTLSVIGTPGTMTVTNYGYTTSITSGRGTAGNSNYLLYVFSWSTPHPLGTNYAVMCNFQGSSTSNLSPNGFFRATGTSTAITVWVRTADGIIKDENFYVYTVP